MQENSRNDKEHLAGVSGYLIRTIRSKYTANSFSYFPTPMFLG